MGKLLTLALSLLALVGVAYADTPSLKEYLARWERLDTSMLSSQLLLSSPAPCPTFFCISSNENDRSCREDLRRYLSEFPASTQQFCERMEVVLNRKKSTGHQLERKFVCRTPVSVAIRSSGVVALEKGILEFCEESPTKGDSKAGISGEGRLYNSRMQEICQVDQVDDSKLNFRCVFGNLEGSFLATRGSGRDTEIYASGGNLQIFMLTRRKLSNVKVRYPEIFQ